MDRGTYFGQHALACRFMAASVLPAVAVASAASQLAAFLLHECVAVLEVAARLAP